MRRAALVPLALALGACEVVSETPPWRIDAPRLLAVAANPPVAMIDGEVRLEALIVGADGVRREDAAIAWRVCSPWRAVADPDGDCPPELALALPVDAAGVATLSIPEVAARFVDRPFVLPPAEDTCDVDPPVQLTVVATTTVDGLRLVATKDVGVGTVPRRAPVISTFRVEGSIDRYFPGQEHELVARPDRATLDSRCASEPPHEPVLERVRVNYYATAGEIDFAESDIRYPLGVEEAEAVHILMPPASAGTLRLWAVAVDRDGGLDWRGLTLEPR